jgi:ribulose-phosphate 3-epimerase
MTVKLAPSILNADFARLGQQVADAERGGADRIHVDVMDGHFVPNLSMGPAIVQSLRRVTRLPLETPPDGHGPDSLLDGFAEAGSDSFSATGRATTIYSRNGPAVRPWATRRLAINPATPDSLEEIVPGKWTRFWS